MLRIDNLLPGARERLVTIRTDALLIDAARMLKGPKLNLVVVCDEADKLAGIITKTDIIDRISGCLGHSCTMAAIQVMTREVITCYPDDWLNEIWSTIKQHGLKNIPS